jgi:hypothetical protein
VVALGDGESHEIRTDAQALGDDVDSIDRFSWIHVSLSGGFCIWRSLQLPAAKAATDGVWNTGSSMSRKRPNHHQHILH